MSSKLPLILLSKDNAIYNQFCLKLQVCLKLFLIILFIKISMNCN